MNLHPPKPGYRAGEHNALAPSLRRIVRKSALLNLAIVLTSLPVLVYAGGPRALLPALKIMAGISLIIWAATYAVFSFVSLAHLFWSSGRAATGGGAAQRDQQSGLADPWLDRTA
jgi:hypothetical protein